MELPDELPPPIPPPVLGDWVVPEVLPDVLPPDVLLEPLPLIPEDDPDVPPDAPLVPEPDLLKCASHSAREICPSLLVSTDEKLGEEALLEELPEAEGREDDDEDPDPPDAADESVELLPDVDGEEADGVEVEGDEVDGLLLDDDDDCATANVESAKRTAAVVTLRALGMYESPGGVVELRTGRCKRHAG